jgi:hypothetical protein
VALWSQDYGVNIRSQKPATRVIAWFLVATSLWTSGCQEPAAAIPSSISDDEYGVYAAWLTRHFKEPPSRLLLSDRTFVFDPLGADRCDVKQLEAQGVSLELLKKLHEIGEAEYVLHTDKFQRNPFKLPWSYEESRGWSTGSGPPFRLVGFSRVAFNRSKSKAFFGVSDACGGLCGGGGALLASRKGSEWLFKSDVRCGWVY